MRFIDKYNLKYAEYIGDGDSNSFGAVKKELETKYGDEYQSEKEDCIDHIQKRMSSALRMYKNKFKGIVLPDGNTVGGNTVTDMQLDIIKVAHQMKT